MPAYPSERTRALFSPAMVKLTEKIHAAEAAGEGPWVAFEFFPPRTADGVSNLYKRFDRMAKQGASLRRESGWVCRAPPTCKVEIAPPMC